MRGEISNVRTDLRSEIASVRNELRAEMNSMRNQFHADINGLRSDTATLVNISNDLDKRVSRIEDKAEVGQGFSLGNKPNGISRGLQPVGYGFRPIRPQIRVPDLSVLSGRFPPPMLCPLAERPPAIRYRKIYL
jgi:hypothetical protein